MGGAPAGNPACGSGGRLRHAPGRVAVASDQLEPVEVRDRCGRINHGPQPGGEPAPTGTDCRSAGPERRLPGLRLTFHPGLPRCHPGHRGLAGPGDLGAVACAHPTATGRLTDRRPGGRGGGGDGRSPRGLGVRDPGRGRSEPDHHPVVELCGAAPVCSSRAGRLLGAVLQPPLGVRRRRQTSLRGPVGGQARYGGPGIRPGERIRRELHVRWPY